MATKSKQGGKTLYFGYGSNLWKAQMRKRCPGSKYLGIARLDGHHWIISERGYANVVESPSTLSLRQGKDVVWGLVYSLTDTDEDNLDVNEGVPIAYTKDDLMVDFWPTHHGNPPKTEEKPERVEMLVYIDRVRTRPHSPKREYVYRMNMGITDLVAEGVPRDYVRSVLREYIPENREEDEEGEGEVKRLATRQAQSFVDEN